MSYNIQIPTDHMVSPEDATPVKFSTYTEDFYDQHGNTWTPADLAPSRIARRIRKWFAENFVSTGGREQ